MQNTDLIDRIINEVDTGLRAIFTPKNRSSNRPSPATMRDTTLTIDEKRHVIGLLRVNHAGEVCAQALYQGQALTARHTNIKEKLCAAAAEEIDHLAWCETRLNELDGKPSRLNLFWYTGSLMIGALAGFAGDSISLGFVAETERQVTLHLTRHLSHLPINDLKTKAILTQMQADEEAHATMAINEGGIDLPQWLKYIMTGVSKLLTKSSYYF